MVDKEVLDVILGSFVSYISWLFLFNIVILFYERFNFLKSFINKWEKGKVNERENKNKKLKEEKWK